MEFENSMKEALKVQEALRDSGKKEIVQEFIEVCRVSGVLIHVVQEAADVPVDSALHAKL